VILRRLKNSDKPGKMDRIEKPRCRQWSTVLGLLAFDGPDYNLHTTNLIPKSVASLTRVYCKQVEFVRLSCGRDPSPRM
jgi:hypothetical protein